MFMYMYMACSIQGMYVYVCHVYMYTCTVHVVRVQIICVVSNIQHARWQMTPQYLAVLHLHLIYIDIDYIF